MQNFFSGVVLIAQRPVDVGDYVMVNGDEGTVKRIGMTHSVLESPERIQIYVPNQSLTTNHVKNYSQAKVMRVGISMLVRHTEDTRLLREIFLEVCACDPRILVWPKPQFRVTELHENGVRISLRPFVKNEDYW